MQEFLQRLSSLGFAPDNIQLDGKIHRFDRGSRGNAWYIGWQNHAIRDGAAYVYAEFGDWRTGERHQHKPDRLTRGDNEAIKAQMSEARRRADEEKRIKQEETATKAARLWASSVRGGRTPYMDRKCIAELYGCGLHGDVLQVPMRDVDGKLWSLQNIQPDGIKRFLTGTKVDGNFHAIGELGAECFLCEGFATGASIREATGKTVVVAFNAGNLVAVAKALKTKHPDMKITVCGDDDRFTMVFGEPKNTGREAAEKAGLIAQAPVVFPAFADDEGKPTDFNDLHVKEGLDAVRQQLGDDATPEPEVGFIPLGYDEGTYFFYHLPSKDIVKASAFTTPQIYQIAPARYWMERYPNAKGDDADMRAAIDDLIQMSRKVGPFDSTRIRGTGVWRDDGRIVVNTGRCLIVDGREVGLTALKSWFIYIQTRNRLPPMSVPLTVAECRPLIDACLGFKWCDPKSGYLMAGWLFNARIAGALPVRPHVWVTGGSGTGKSTAMKDLIAPALGCQKGKIYLQGNSTEAGIRQRMKCSSVPPIFDEFETTGEGSRERVGNLVELFRNTWSETQGAVVKGSAAGHSVEYNLQFAGLVSSVRVELTNDADRSRFSILELDEHRNDREHYRALRAALKRIDEAYGERLFARAAGMVDTVRRSQDRISDALAGAVNQRYGQQVGMLLAGYWCLTSDEVIPEKTAAALVAELDLAQEKSEAEITDQYECLAHLMTWKIVVRKFAINGGTETQEMSIGSAIEKSEHDTLRAYGIRVEGREILIADTHAELAKIYSRTRWGSWKRPLSRLNGAARQESPIRFAGIQSRATKIPLSYVRDIEPPRPILLSNFEA